MDTLLAILPPVLSSIFAGGVASWLVTRLYLTDLRRISLDLEYRLEDLEGRMTREVKKRAEMMSKSGKEVDREIIEMAKNQSPSGNSLGGVNLEEWRKKAFFRNA